MSTSVQKFIYSQKFHPLVGMTYDTKTNHTRTIDELLRDRKGICFDFVNYLYFKNGKTGHCYFMWFNNKDMNTHTIYVTDDMYKIEATPNPDEGKLRVVYIDRIPSVESVVKRLVRQMTDGRCYHKSEPLY